MFSGQDDRPVAILVTEVDAVVRMTTVDLLLDAGLRTIEARDAQEALALLSAHASVRLLIAGRSLPGEIDGIGLARIAHQQRPSLGIIVTTGGFAVAAEDLPPGARLLLKPYSFEDLMQVVPSCLKTWRRPRAPPWCRRDSHRFIRLWAVREKSQRPCQSPTPPD